MKELKELPVLRYPPLGHRPGAAHFRCRCRVMFSGPREVRVFIYLVFSIPSGTGYSTDPQVHDDWLPLSCML